MRKKWEREEKGIKIKKEILLKSGRKTRKPNKKGEIKIWQNDRKTSKTNSWKGLIGKREKSSVRKSD